MSTGGWTETTWVKHFGGRMTIGRDFLNTLVKLTHRDSKTTPQVGTPVIPISQRGHGGTEAEKLAEDHRDHRWQSRIWFLLLGSPPLHHAGACALRQAARAKAQGPDSRSPPGTTDDGEAGQISRVSICSWRQLLSRATAAQSFSCQESAVKFSPCPG